MRSSSILFKTAKIVQQQQRQQQQRNFSEAASSNSSFVGFGFFGLGLPFHLQRLPGKPKGPSHLVPFHIHLIQGRDAALAWPNPAPSPPTPAARRRCRVTAAQGILHFAATCITPK
jgi:hypothetical protein